LNKNNGYGFRRNTGANNTVMVNCLSILGPTDQPIIWRKTSQPQSPRMTMLQYTQLGNIYHPQPVWLNGVERALHVIRSYCHCRATMVIDPAAIASL
jgi:hypothetical protein